MVTKRLMVLCSKGKEGLHQALCKSRYVILPAVVTAASAFPAFAAEDSSFDVTTVLASSFQSMATTILGTISATLPVVMSVMSAYICINFGIRFFRKFVK